MTVLSKAPSGSAPSRAQHRDGPGPSVRRQLAGRAAVALAVAAGVVLRFVATSPLWLDEAISVDIARLPLGDLVEALRHDGHPPLYYILLHGWTALFGTSDVAVRSLTGLVSVATLPLAWAAGRRVGGRRAAVIALVVVATSPFAIRYATEARMYALLSFLAIAGYLAVQRALETPTRGRLIVVATIVAAALYTHYWALWLVAAAVLLLAASVLRGPRRRRTRLRVMASLVIGGLAFLPWLPVLAYQSRHTGTPWARSVEPFDAGFDTLLDFGGGKWAGGRVLGPILAGLVGLALLARPLDRWRLELDLRTVPGARVLVAIAGMTMGIGLLVAVAASSGFQPRYAAGAFPFVALAVAVGVLRLPNPKLQWAVVALVAATGLAGAARQGVSLRTQGGEIAAVLEADAAPGDLVVYCPDQLRPAVQRLVERTSGPGPDGISFPAGGPTGRVDWVDYADRVDAETPAVFTDRVLAEAGGDGTIWLVEAESYRTFGDGCEQIRANLDAARGPDQIVLDENDDAYERATLHRFGAR